MNKKKILSLIMALVMLVGVFSPLTALAAGENEPAKVKVNLHKILISQDALDKHDSNKKYDPTKGVNVKEFFGDDNAKEINGVYFVAIKEDETGYDDFDKKSKDEQDAILKEIPADRQGETKNVEGTDGVIQFDLDNPGNYKIYEVKHKSTYKGPNGEVLTGMKAIPVDLKLPEHARTEAGVQNEIHVYPKNSEDKVKFDKNFAKQNGLEAITDPNQLKDVGAVMENYEKEKANAKAHIDKEVPYEAKAELPKGSVFTHLDLADSMDKGLKYNEENGVTVTVTPELDQALVAGTDYTVTTVGNGFKVHFNQSGLDKLNKAAEKNKLSIEFTYSAKVTADAIVDKPMDNHATFTYNHEPPQPSSEKLTPVDQSIKVKKDWADGNAPTDIFVKYVLLDENDMPVADVTFKTATTVDETELGNGITFEQTGNYAGTFKGLEEGKQYKVKEIVNGYEPEYKVESTTGTVTVTNTKTPTSITPTPPQVTVGGKKFVKTNQDGTKRLAGAEFAIQNKNGGTDNDKYLKITEKEGTAYADAEKAYNDAIAAVNEALAKGEISATNKVTIAGQEYESKDAAMTKVEELRVARDKAFTEGKLSYTWVDDIEQATKFTSNDKGQFEVKGLEYGNYRAVETKAPAGYALPTNGGNFTFEIAKGTYTGEGTIDYVADSGKNDAMQITNNDVTIPQTGGMGTVLFTIVGISLMAGAVVAMKRNREEA